LAIGFIACAPAFADIKAYNAAVKAGDYKTAAAEAEAIWQTWDKQSPDTALMAREFGFAALVSGRNELAQTFGSFLVQNGKTLATPDDQPATSAVLKAAADFKVSKQGEPERAVLRDALMARNAAPGADMTSVLAWQALYTASWSKADWANTVTETAAAAEFFKRQPGSLISRQREAEVAGAAASFNDNRGRTTMSRNDFYDRMVDLHDAIVADINAAKSASTRDQLWKAKWSADAWSGAIYSYLSASYTKIGSNISKAAKQRTLAQPATPQIAEDPALAAIPVCEGKFQGRQVQYPEVRIAARMVGSVIVRMETDASGKVARADVLSAIPGDGFEDRVLEAVKTWTYTPAKGVDTRSCRLASRNFVERFMFKLG
jgi:TonB family protein